MGLQVTVGVFLFAALIYQSLGIYIPRDQGNPRDLMEDSSGAASRSYNKAVEDYYNFLETLGRLYYARGRRSRQDNGDQGEFTRMYRNPDFMNNHAEAIMRGLG